ncbi:MAG TPA: Rrf2 family transcriptional regulator, partial [Kaistia sp.]|nr:Rrf2 family transcriptional regulator [Kaistia sp.]
MISQKAKYAFKALIHLAKQPQGETTQIDDIARQAGVPRKFLEHILLDLKHRGIIASRRGRAGGYVMIKQPGEVTIG